MFLTRLLSGIVLVLVALATMWSGGLVLCLVIAALSLIGYLELTTASGVSKNKKSGLEIIGIIGILLYDTVLYLCTTLGLDTHFAILVTLIAVFIGEMFVYVFAFPKFNAEQTMASFFSFVYAPIGLSFIYLTRQLPNGIYFVWLILLCSWGCDTCAYCVGVLFGKHKMSPILSPKKSVEGAVGGVVGAGLLGALYGLFVQTKLQTGGSLIGFFVVICMVGALISMVGDLAASAIKRNHEIKDYGKLIPGHGGVMDRFDSVIFVSPLLYFMVFLLSKMSPLLG